MRFAIHTSQAAAVAHIAAIDRDMGLPRRGVRLNPGRQRWAENASTDTWAEPRKHPRMDAWAVPLPDSSDGAAVERIGRATIVDKLTDDWMED